MRNYGEITINDTKVFLRFGLPAIRQLSDREVKLGEIGDTYREMAIAEIFFAGYTNGCLVSREMPVLEFADFMDYVEDKFIALDFQELNAAMLTFNESRSVKALAERKSKKDDQQEEPEKKSLIGMK